MKMIKVLFKRKSYSLETVISLKSLKKATGGKVKVRIALIRINNNFYNG
jgi:hypothetical protein